MQPEESTKIKSMPCNSRSDNWMASSKIKQQKSIARRMPLMPWMRWSNLRKSRWRDGCIRKGKPSLSRSINHRCLGSRKIRSSDRRGKSENHSNAVIDASKCPRMRSKGTESRSTSSWQRRRWDPRRWLWSPCSKSREMPIKSNHEMSEFVLSSLYLIHFYIFQSNSSSILSKFT